MFLCEINETTMMGKQRDVAKRAEAAENMSQERNPKGEWNLQYISVGLRIYYESLYLVTHLFSASLVSSTSLPAHGSNYHLHKQLVHFPPLYYVNSRGS